MLQAAHQSMRSNPTVVLISKTFRDFSLTFPPPQQNFLRLWCDQFTIHANIRNGYDYAKHFSK